MPISPIYDSDISTEMALRRAGATEESFVQFTTIRSLPGSASAAFSFGTHALRPASAATGDEYFETDRSWLYYWAGTAWKFLSGINSGTDAVRAAITVTANDNGAEFYTTDTQKLWRVIAGAWSQTDISSIAPAVSVVTRTTNFTLTDANDVVLVDCTAGAVTATLHAVATAKLKPYYFKKIDASANAMVLDPNAAEQIDGAATLSATVRYTAYTLVPNSATEWSIV